MHATASPDTLPDAPAPLTAGRGRFRPISESEARRLDEIRESRPDEEERAAAADCPRIVPLDLWNMTFPPDRDQVKRLAAQRYRAGTDAVEAYMQAERQHVRNSILASPGTRSTFERLCAAFGDDMSGAVEECLLRAAASVWRTAVLHGRHILGPGMSPGDRPSRRKMLEQAWLRRGWHAAPGECLLSGMPVRQGAKGFPRHREPGGKQAQDEVNPEYLGRLPAVAKMYSRLVVAFSFVLHRKDRAALRESEAHDHCDADEADAFVSWIHEFGDVKIRPDVPAVLHERKADRASKDGSDTALDVRTQIREESCDTGAEADFETLIT